MSTISPFAAVRRSPSGRPGRSAPLDAAGTSDTSSCTDGDSPTMSSTGPAATIRPLLTTTTWVQVCSTSASRWLETSTARPSVAYRLQHPAHLGDLRRVEAVGRLVQHQQLGQAEHGLGDGQPLPHAVAVVLGLAVHRVAQPGDLQRLVEPGVRRRAARWPASTPAGCRTPLRCGRKPGPFDQRADPGQHRRAGHQPVPEDQRVARGRHGQAHQHPQRGGLAGAVRARAARPPGRVRR